MPSSIPTENSREALPIRVLKAGGSVLASTVKYLLAIWVFGLIWYAAPFPGAGNIALAVAWAALLLAIPFRIRRSSGKWLAVAALFLIALLPYYLFVRPSHNRDWQKPQEFTAYAEVDGEKVTVHHFRSFDYGPDSEIIPNWSTREFDLKNLTGMDFFMTTWGSGMAGHPIFSFDFGEQGHLAFTIEARMEKGETFSLIPGLYRRYELSYIPSEESDAVRVRTNFRENENVCLYRTVATPKQARDRFMEFLETMDDIRKQPRFYNIISSNCTTAVRSQMTGGFPFDWRIIINGKLDEMLHERGLLVTGGLKFDELKRRAFLNPKLREHPEKAGFSERVREGVTGF